MSSFTYIYSIKNDIKLLDTLNYTLDEFKYSPKKCYPNWDNKLMYATDTKFTNPILTNGIIREKTREEEIKDGKYDLLNDGEYFDGTNIIYVPMLENISKQEWDKKNHIWIDLRSNLDKLLDLYEEYKQLDTPLGIEKIKQQNSYEEYVSMMLNIEELILTSLHSDKKRTFKSVNFSLPIPSKKLQILKDITKELRSLGKSSK